MANHKPDSNAKNLTSSGLRLNKYLATHYGCSRRDADRLIDAKRVKINGRVAVLGDTQQAGDVVSIDDTPVREQQEYTYIKFYKPKGMLSTYASNTVDTEGKATLMDIPQFAKNKLPYAGRLDYDSEGLMILSNHRELVSSLSHPSSRSSKVYRVWASRSLTPNEIRDLEAGIAYKGMQYAPCHIHPIGTNKYSVTLYEGKNRQIRNMFRFMDIHVRRLVRVSVASVRLDGMKAGEFRTLTAQEVASLGSRSASHGSQQSQPSQSSSSSSPSWRGTRSSGRQNKH